MPSNVDLLRLFTHVSHLNLLQKYKICLVLLKCVKLIIEIEYCMSLHVSNYIIIYYKLSKCNY